jgi:hypothetical protein
MSSTAAPPNPIQIQLLVSSPESGGGGGAGSGVGGGGWGCGVGGGGGDGSGVGGGGGGCWTTGIVKLTGSDELFVSSSSGTALSGSTSKLTVSVSPLASSDA